MACYRLYHIRGAHFSGFEAFEAPDDARAMAEAERLNSGRGHSELWRAGHKIRRLSATRQAAS
jgi:hypothetical protein